MELATEGKAVSNRQLAGLYIKNLITAQVWHFYLFSLAILNVLFLSTKDDAILQKKTTQWLQCDGALKDQIRAGVSIFVAFCFCMEVDSIFPFVCLAVFGGYQIPGKVCEPYCRPSVGSIRRSGRSAQ